MRVAIRADTAPKMGKGHVARCDTLARAAAGRGAEVLFLSRGLREPLQAIVSKASYEFRTIESSLPAGYGDVDVWPEEVQLADAQMTLAAFAGPAPDWMVVDHYHLDATWEAVLRARGSRVMVIDDQANRLHDCELLLDQNYYEDMHSRYARLVPTGCRQLLGPRYALLRPEFRTVREAPRVRSASLERVLITFGGNDPLGLTCLALRALATPLLDQIHVDVVVGDAAENRTEIETAVRDLRSCEVHVQIDYMASLMVEADLAIGGAGATSWERCACGLPAIVTALAANQRPIAAALGQLGCVRYVGAASDLTEHALRNAVCAVAADPTELLRMSEAARALVDADGALRVCGVMEGTA
jgi:UDP-2,4-diacetamido-2,4,6-trideoxy-beta-L-altropyranose hydrolase